MSRHLGFVRQMRTAIFHRGIARRSDPVAPEPRAWASRSPRPSRDSRQKRLGALASVSRRTMLRIEDSPGTRGRLPRGHLHLPRRLVRRCARGPRGHLHLPRRLVRRRPPISPDDEPASRRGYNPPGGVDRSPVTVFEPGLGVRCSAPSFHVDEIEGDDVDALGGKPAGEGGHERAQLWTACTVGEHHCRRTELRRRRPVVQTGDHSGHADIDVEWSCHTCTRDTQSCPPTDDNRRPAALRKSSWK